MSYPSRVNYVISGDDLDPITIEGERDQMPKPGDQIAIENGKGFTLLLTVTHVTCEPGGVSCINAAIGHTRLNDSET